MSKLFDVTEDSNLEDTLHTEENHITVAFGSGIVGTVALTKTSINIKDAYQVTCKYLIYLRRYSLKQAGRPRKRHTMDKFL